jgi:hypothetical protein
MRCANVRLEAGAPTLTGSNVAPPSSRDMRAFITEPHYRQHPP